MRWIVDGMNVMGSRPDGWWRDRAGARRRLIADLGAFRQRSGVDEVDVVFDGRHQAADVAAGQAADIAVVFAPGGPDAADRVIASMVRAMEDRTGAIVVTSDGALAAEVRSGGVAVLGAAAFRRMLEERGGGGPVPGAT